MEEINNPAFECKAYKDQVDDLVIVNDCFEGTSAVAKKGQVYLRKYGAESSEDFSARLSSSKFWNAFRRTVRGLVGLVFRKNPIINKSLPTEIQDQLNNIDLQGTHVDVFLKERCTKGMIDGHCFILVDMEQSVLAENPDATLADEKAANLRPYWVGVNKNQVVNWRVSKKRGYEELSQVSIKECLMEPVGLFGEREVVQYRILYPGRWEIWRETSEGKQEWAVYDNGTTSLDYIPLVPFYAMQTGYFQSNPPLLDVAHENLRHYNLQSGLDRVLDLCNVPTPVCKGRPDPKVPLIVGAGVIDIPTDGDVSYLEPTGVAIETTQNEIDRCKSNIASLGLLLLSSQPKVTKTATETTVEHTAETSELAAIARNLQDCAERCVIIHSDYSGQMLDDASDSIKINRDFVKAGIDPQAWARLQDDVANNRLTLETYWKILEGAEVLPEEFEAETEKPIVDAEKEKAATLTGTMFNQFSQGVGADARFSN